MILLDNYHSLIKGLMVAFAFHESIIANAACAHDLCDGSLPSIAKQPSNGNEHGILPLIISYLCFCGIGSPTVWGL